MLQVTGRSAPPWAQRVAGVRAVREVGASGAGAPGESCASVSSRDHLRSPPAPGLCECVRELTGLRGVRAFTWLAGPSVQSSEHPVGLVLASRRDSVSKNL